MSEILRLENLDYSYIDGGYERSILKDLSYSFESGKFYTILGPSGSGKTTLLSIIAGLDTAKSGKIYFNGEDVDKIGLYKYRRNKIAVVFQQYNLISYMTALENVMLAMSETDNELPKDKKMVAYNLLKKFGIVETKANRLVGQLSGGEQQRVAIARAIVNEPKLLLCDEPTGNLDPDMSMEIMQVLEEINKSCGTTIIMATHDKDIVNRMQKEVIVLKDGHLVKHVEKGEYEEWNSLEC